MLTIMPSWRPASQRSLFASPPLRKNRTDPSPNANIAPPGCQLLNAWDAGPLTVAESKSIHHITLLIQIELAPVQGAGYCPDMPTQTAARLVTSCAQVGWGLGSHLHS